MSISLSKWPMLPTIAWCFIRAMCSAVMMSLLPVAVMKMSARVEHVLEAGHLVALHRGLQRADRVDLGDDDAGALAAQRLGAALADVAVAADDGDLAADHHVGGAVDAVDERVAAAVEVVELRLGDRVVDVDGREQQLAGLEHLVEAVHAGGGLLGDALDALRRWRSSARAPRQRAAAAARARPATPSESLVGGVGHDAGVLVLGALVHQHAWRRHRRRGSCWGRSPSGQRSACSVHHQYSSSVSPFQANTGTPWGSSTVPLGPDGDGRGGLVLGGEDVAAGPAHVGAEAGRASR